jgi:hypothetical protein
MSLQWLSTWSIRLSHMTMCFIIKTFLTVTALYSLLSADPNPPVLAGSYQVLPFTEEQVRQFSLDLCEVLQFEFIFTQPCRQLETAIKDVLTQFRYKEILLCVEVCCVCVYVRARAPVCVHMHPCVRTCICDFSAMFPGMCL